MAGGSFVGLDIGSNQIKVAELRRSGNTVQVVAMGVAQTPPDAYSQSDVVDAQMLGQAVKELLKQSGISTKDVVSSVSGQASVVVRVIEVPQMNDNELAETMKWEVERHVPFANSEVVMDYARIDRPEGYAEGQNMDVLLAVAQQDLIDRHVEMLTAAGLKPKFIDVEPLALGRTLLDLDTEPRQAGYTVCILNIGACNTEIGIYRDKLLTFPRTLPIAGDNMTRAIAQNFGVDTVTAEKYKLDFAEVILDQLAPATPDFGGGATFGGGLGFQDFSAPPVNPFGAPPDPFTAAATAGESAGASPFDFASPGEAPPPQTGAPLEFGAPAPQAPALAENLPASVGYNDPAREAMKFQVFSAIAPILAELSQEVRRSMDYYRGRAGDAFVNEIQLVGGTANLKGLAQFLEMELGIPVRVPDVMKHVQITAKSMSQNYAHEVAPLFPISIGLGVRELIGGPSTKKSKPKGTSKK